MQAQRQPEASHEVAAESPRGRFAFATGSALVIAFCGEAAMHQLSWNAARSFHITKRGGLGGVDDTLFSLLLSRPKVCTWLQAFIISWMVTAWLVHVP